MKIELIPLSKLVPSPANMRKTGAAAGIDELAASIAAHGLLQNLQVRPGSNGKFEVVAGGRRLAALKRLAKARTIAKDAAIACHVLDEANAAEISLAENIMRLPVHPADQYEAFKTLADQGKGPEEIAARFGCGTAVIQQRLRLASVSPSLLDAYRNDDMDLDQLMAFAVSDDHGAQEKVWSQLPEWNRHPSTIRRLLTQAHVEANDRRARFVGVDAYVAAGGYVLRDLFEPEHEGYLTDPALLEGLAVERLLREAEAVRAEGWKWLEIEPQGVDYDALRRFRRVHPEREPIGEEQQAELDRLTERYDALVAEHGDEPPEPIVAELEDISEHIDALSEGSARWLPEDIARAGAIVGIGFGGKLSVERGLLRPEDMPEDQAARQNTGGNKGGGKERKRESAELPAPLVEDLTARRTAALRAALADNPDVALASVVHALALPLFYPPYGAQTCLAINLESEDLRGSSDGIEECTAMATLAERHVHWRQRLPEASEDLWSWLLEQDTATQLDLLAYCAGCTVNAVVKAHDRSDERIAHADRLAVALSLDMTAWWQPTAASYLGCISKARILEAVAEGVSREAAENLMKLKKDALVVHAEERLAGSGWLPALLRSPVLP